MNVIFMTMSPDGFKRIFMCEITNEAWDIFKATHEETKTVKNYKLQMLTLIFEEIWMLENKSFTDFYAKLNEIVNSRFNLGKKVEESWIVGKILKSLSERFCLEITTI